MCVVPEGLGEEIALVIRPGGGLEFVRHLMTMTMWILCFHSFVNDPPRAGRIGGCLPLVTAGLVINGPGQG